MGTIVTMAEQCAVTRKDGLRSLLQFHGARESSPESALREPCPAVRPGAARGPGARELPEQLRASGVRGLGPGRDLPIRSGVRELPGESGVQCFYQFIAQTRSGIERMHN